MSVYLACWPVDPDTPLHAAHAAALVELRRLHALAGVAACAQPDFYLVDTLDWRGGVGEPGDLLLVSFTDVHAVSRADADTRADASPATEPTADYLPADVVLRERGRAARADRTAAARRLRAAGRPATAIATTSRLCSRTVERLLAEAGRDD